MSNERNSRADFSLIVSFASQTLSSVADWPAALKKILIQNIGQSATEGFRSFDIL